MVDVVKYDPWTLLDLNFRDFFEQPMGFLPEMPPKSSCKNRFLPAIDIKKEEKQYLIYLDMPGVNQKDIEVNVENSRLLISATRKTRSEEKCEDYTCVERFSGKYHRSLSLPDDAKCEDIKAIVKDGVLTITVPRKEIEPTYQKKIEVKSE